MNKKLHIKKGDIVYVNAGNDKGKTGKVLSVNKKDDRSTIVSAKSNPCSYRDLSSFLPHAVMANMDINNIKAHMYIFFAFFTLNSSDRIFIDTFARSLSSDHFLTNIVYHKLL